LVEVAARLAPASLLVQALQLGSSVALATQLGATTQTDAYYLALAVAVLVSGALILALRQGAIPALTSIRSSQSADEFAAACNEIIGATLVIGVLLSAVATAIALLLIPAVAGSSSHLVSPARTYVLELAPYSIAGAILGTLESILSVRAKFTGAALVLGFEPASKAVLVLTLGHQIGAQTLVLGTLAGNALAVATLWALVRGDGVALRPRVARATPVVRGIVKLSAPLLVSNVLLSINPLVDRGAAAALGAGSVTVFELGVRLFTAPIGLLVNVIIAPLAAIWAWRMTEQGWDAVVDSFRRLVASIVLIMPPLIVIGFVMRRELVTMIYHGGAYSVADVRRTSDVLGMLLLGLLPQVLIVPLATLFIIRRATIVNMTIGVANFFLNAALDFALRGPLGVTGIALSTAATTTLLCGAYVWQAVRRWGSLGLRTATVPAVVSLTASAAIVVSLLAMLHIAGSPTSRVQSLAVVALALALGLPIHGSLLLLARSRIAPFLPAAGERMLGAPAAWLRALTR
jgi:putative peptidoglycan lipid II flippase